MVLDGIGKYISFRNIVFRCFSGNGYLLQRENGVSKMDIWNNGAVDSSLFLPAGYFCSIRDAAAFCAVAQWDLSVAAAFASAAVWKRREEK